MFKNLILVDREGETSGRLLPTTLESDLPVGAARSWCHECWHAAVSGARTRIMKKGHVRLTTLDPLDGCIRDMDTT